MSDLIERDETIRRIDKWYGDEHYTPAIISIIESMPSADRPQGEVDAIDRDALIDYCLKLIDVERKQGSDVMNYGQERVNQTEAIIDYIEHMPHVNADRPQGEWIRTGRTNIYGGIEVQCSNCGDKVMVQHLEDEWYCRHCGADMGMKGADDAQR